MCILLSDDTLPNPLPQPPLQPLSLVCLLPPRPPPPGPPESNLATRHEPLCAACPCELCNTHVSPNLALDACIRMAPPEPAAQHLLSAALGLGPRLSNGGVLPVVPPSLQVGVLSPSAGICHAHAGLGLGADPQPQPPTGQRQSHQGPGVNVRRSPAPAQLPGWATDPIGVWFRTGGRLALGPSTKAPSLCPPS